jgi:drug/metabolite transporter (DMT)-like permease
MAGLSAYLTPVSTTPSGNPAAPAFRPGLAIILRLLAVVCGGLLAVVVKLATERGASTLEIVFFRYIIALPFVTWWALANGGVAAIRTTRLSGHLLRSLLGMTAMLCVFMTVGALPLAESTTLLFTSPLMATILSIVMLREAVGIHRWLAIALGIVGMLIIVQPGGNSGLNAGGVALGLFAAFLNASTTIAVRQLGSTETSTVMAFWFTLVGAVTTGLALPFFFKPHDPIVWVLYACAALVATSGQVLMTSALRYAPVGLLAPFEYTSLLWMTFFGWLIWSDLPTIPTLVGAAFIGGAGLYTFYREHLRRRPGIAESTTVSS